MKVTILPVFFLFVSILSFGQKTEYSIASIPDSLKQNANAVVRLNLVNINIPAQDKMVLQSLKVITILNEYGLEDLDLSEGYSKNDRVNKIEATVYDAFGKQVKAYKRKDFKDVSATDGGTIFSDNRKLYLDYTPVSYPFTVAFESETETPNTVFIPAWRPIDSYFVSTQNTTFTVTFKPELKLKIKEFNFSDKIAIEKKETPSSVSYSAKNLTAYKPEEMAPSIDLIFPRVMFGLNSFSLEGIKGNAETWKEMGKWFYDDILSGTTDLPEETKAKIKSLVGAEKDPLKIAEIVYKYVQGKTRYVSIQEGIGGWRPMLAKDVDKLGYGDCKALTNYTRALLSEVGVTSFYTRLYGQRSKREVYPDIVSFQSNHVILAIPNKTDYVWLECTSQIQPFGFQGDFTDDRNAFVLKPDGGEIVRTKNYDENENVQQIKGFYKITDEGDFVGKVKIVSRAIRYDNEFVKERMSHEDQVKNYKEEFSNINNLSIKKISLNNNQKNVEFTEEIELEAEGYAQNSGGKLMFALNAFDQSYYVPKKYRTREFSFQEERGYTNEDEIEITIPDGFVVEAKPNGIEQENEFGYYKIEFNTLAPNKISCKRKLVIKKGFYDKSKYENYRKFREIIAKTDNSKVVIAKT